MRSDARMSDDVQIGKTGKRSAWDNRITVRRLCGVQYQALEDSDDIHDYVNTSVRKELEEDLQSMVPSAEQATIISSLPKRRWRLEVVNIHDVQLNPLIMNSSDTKTGRVFKERLAERRSELRKALEAGGLAIPPIVLLRERQLLVDGYCRHSTLKEMDITEAFAYVGRIVDSHIGS